MRQTEWLDFDTQEIAIQKLVDHRRISERQYELTNRVGNEKREEGER